MNPPQTLYGMRVIIHERRVVAKVALRAHMRALLGADYYDRFNDEMREMFGAVVVDPPVQPGQLYVIGPPVALDPILVCHRDDWEKIQQHVAATRAIDESMEAAWQRFKRKVFRSAL